jgi:cytochrome c oxidase assembly factor CtaG
MQPVYQAVLRSWSIPPATTFAIVLSALIYLRGWRLLRRTGTPFLPPWRAVTFLAGLFLLWVALASPMDVFNGFLLTAHMLQHMVLMMVAPPLILLGAPLIPLVRGLPIFAAREFAGPFVNWSVAQKVGNTLTNPVCALLLMGVAMFAWHTPTLYELALRSSTWHQVEHACFFLTSLIFWWPVVQPWPSKTQWPRWAMIPYLLVADIQNTTLSAILCFSDRVLYPSYSTTPRLFGFSALEDQVAAGAIMWVMGSLAYVVPAIVIAVHCLSSKATRALPVSARRPDRSFGDELLTGTRKIPLVPRFLRARLTARTLEAINFGLLFALAGLCFAGLVAAGSNDDDNQVLRFKGISGPFEVAVFAPAGDLKAGPSVFSVLVQERNTREVLLDTTIDLTTRPTGDAEGAAPTARASYSDSENKLLQTVELNLPAASDCKLGIVLRRNAEVADFSLPLRVVKAETQFTFPWGYLFVLAVALLLFVVYLSRHASRMTHPVSQSVAE